MFNAESYLWLVSRDKDMETAMIGGGHVGVDSLGGLFLEDASGVGSLFDSNAEEAESEEIKVFGDLGDGFEVVKAESDVVLDEDFEVVDADEVVDSSTPEEDQIMLVEYLG